MIISNSNLRGFFSPQVQLMSNQRRYLCGCQKIIPARSLQASLNVWILINIIRLGLLAEYRGQTRLFGIFQ